MTRHFSRRFFLTTSIAALAAPALAGAPATSLRPHARPGGAGAVAAKPAVSGVAALLAEARLSGRVAFAVADVKTGLLLEGVEAEVGQPPASVAKAVTALYALETLGGGFRFSTQLLATASVSNGVLSGDLVLAGGGDPTLDTDALAEMAKQLKAAGVREVRGKFLVWDGLLPQLEQIDADQPDHVSYNPALSGIALNYNAVHFEWKRQGKGYGVTMEARTEKYRPAVDVARMTIVDRAGPVYTYANKGGRDEWTVAKGALGKGGSRWLPVRHPAAYAGDVFRTLARANGIVLDAARVTSARPAGRVLVAHQSADLNRILRDMLKYSNNLTAEMVGMVATSVRKGRPGSLKASAGEMNRWAAQSLGMSQAQLVDHSGLESDSRMSAQDLTKALVRVYKAGQLKPILKEVAMRDAKGSVVKGGPIRVQAKTGTLNFVSGLAGYVTAQDGTELAFAFFAADEKARAAIPRADREQPKGASGWNQRAKKLQQALITRWGTLYGS